MNATTTNLKRAIEKAGLTVERHEHTGYSSQGPHTTVQYIARNGDRILSWYDQDGRAVAVRNGFASMPDDIGTDLFMGTFHRTIRAAVGTLAADDCTAPHGSQP